MTVYEMVTSRYRDPSGNLIELTHRAGLLPPPTVTMYAQFLRGGSESAYAMVPADPREYRYEGHSS